MDEASESGSSTTCWRRRLLGVQGKPQALRESSTGPSQYMLTFRSCGVEPSAGSFSDLNDTSSQSELRLQRQVTDLEVRMAKMLQYEKQMERRLQEQAWKADLLITELAEVQRQRAELQDRLAVHEHEPPVEVERTSPCMEREDFDGGVKQQVQRLEAKIASLEEGTRCSPRSRCTTDRSSDSTSSRENNCAGNNSSVNTSISASSSDNDHD